MYIRLYAKLKLLLVRLEYVTIKSGGVSYTVYFLRLAVSFSNGTDRAYTCTAGKPNLNLLRGYRIRRDIKYTHTSGRNKIRLKLDNYFSGE